MLLLTKNVRISLGLPRLTVKVDAAVTGYRQGLRMM